MIEVIPAMDLMGGSCVRLLRGDFSQKTEYASDPVAVARQFEAAGFQRLHMVDLDGAKAGSPVHLDVLGKVATATSLKIDFSGGIKTTQDIENVFACGASFAAIGSMAVKNKSLFLKWLLKYGSEKILLGVDVRQEKLAVSGWLEQTNISLFDFLVEMMSADITQIFCTDIAKDGLMEGPSIALYERVITQFPDLQLIASGGVRSPQDLVELNEIGCSGAIVGKAIYENMETLSIWLPSSKQALNKMNDI